MSVIYIIEVRVCILLLGAETTGRAERKDCSLSSAEAEG